MSYTTASNLCYFGTTNPMVREAITAILAGEHAKACDLLATAFMDTKEELDREQVAAQFTAKEDADYISFLRDEMEEAAADASRYKKEAEEQEARADHFQEIYEDYKGDALAARRMQEYARSVEAQVKQLEEQLRESQALAASIDKDRIQALKDLHNAEVLNEWATHRIDVLQEQLEEAIDDAKHQKATAEKLEGDLAEAQEEAEKGRKAIWGGGIQLVFEDEEEGVSTAPVSPAFELPTVVKAEPAEKEEQLFYPPLQLAKNGCLLGCHLCAAEAAAQEEDGIDRSELEDDLDMVRLFQTTYTDGTPYQPEKPLSFADVLRKATPLTS